MSTNLFDIQEWAEHYSFDQLSEDKQEIVLNSIGRNEYDDWHTLIISTKSFLKEEHETMEPDPSIFASLEQRVKKRSPLAALWTVRIPFYKAAAASLLVGIGTYLLLNDTKIQTVVVEKEVPVIEVVRDTITREIPSVEYVVRYLPTPKDEPTISSSYEPETDYSRKDVGEPPQMGDISRSFGNTVVSADALEQFKVKI